MTKDEALKLALRALERLACLGNGVMRGNSIGNQIAIDALTAIKEALAQPEQEPVAFASHGVVNWIADKQFQHEALLYSAPQRTWVGLTDEDRLEFAKAQHGWEDLLIAAEAKLKTKNT